MSDTLPAVRESGGVPALAGTPALNNITPDDLKLQKLYRGEYQSDLVQDEDSPVTAGCIYLATGTDDPDPQVLVKDATKSKGVLVHVLRLDKGKSGRIDGEFRSFPFAHPDNPATQDGGKALDTVFSFTVAIPEVDEDMPVKVHMSKTSAGCAQRIITRLLKAGKTGKQTYDVAFRLGLKKREAENNGSKYRWFVWQEEFVEDPSAEHVAIAADLAGLAAAAAAATVDEPTPVPADQPRI